VSVKSLAQFLQKASVSFTTGGAPIELSQQELLARVRPALAVVQVAPAVSAPNKQLWKPKVPRISHQLAAGTAAAWSPDGNLIACASASGVRGEVCIYRFPSGQQIGTLQGHADYVQQV